MASLIAAVAVGAALILAACGGETAAAPVTTAPTTVAAAPVAAQPAPTTTVAPTTTIPPTTTTTEAPVLELSADQLATVEGLVAGHNSDDVNDLNSQFTPDAAIATYRGFAGFGTDDARRDPESVKSMLSWFTISHAFASALNGEWSLGECSPLEDGRAKCEVTYSDDFSRVLGKTWGHLAFVEGDPGIVSAYRLQHLDGAEATAAWVAFFDWLVETDEADAEIAGVERRDGWFPRFDQASGEMIASYLEAYEAFLNG